MGNFARFYFTSGAVNHLDYLGVQVAWISGPWFLSIFMNTLPWESGEDCSTNLPPNHSLLLSITLTLIASSISVLRVWDVLLYDGNRVMLFRTALALMELYGMNMILRIKYT